MVNISKHTQNPETIGTSLAEVAAGGAKARDWEVFHDPATGQMRMIQRGAELPPDGNVVTSIASTGFAATA